MRLVINALTMGTKMCFSRGVPRHPFESAWIDPLSKSIRRYHGPSSRFLTMTSDVVPPANRLLQLVSLRNTYSVLRHGHSLANQARIISSNPDVATIMHGLSPIGHEQAIAAADSVVEYFNKNDFDGIVILSSDFLRATETAQHVSRRFSSNSSPSQMDNESCMQLFLEARLRERWFGAHDGGPDDQYSVVWKDDALDPNHTLSGVESVHSVMRRATECVLDCEQTHDNKFILVVAHGDVLQILQTAFNKMDGSMHRSVEHLETATLRPLVLAGSGDQ
jgi:broad specificity phosphatase PhoE